MPELKKDPAFYHRGLTSIAYVGLWAISLCNPRLFLAFVAVLYLWGVVETQRILFRQTITASLFYQLAGGMLFVAAFISLQGGVGTPAIGLGIFTCIYIVVSLSFLFGKISSQRQALFSNFLSLTYPGLGLVCFALIAFPAGGMAMDYTRPLAFLLFVWGNDSFAYLFGRRWGKTMMAPSVSPQKSWEGFAGGMVGTGLTAVAVWLVMPGMSVLFIVLAAVVVAFFGPAGDLFESALKRRAGVKDSGRWLPGHGGVLDRIDSLLLAAPIYWSLEQLILPLFR
jgi:phosphatidate cytidylyltransferase